LVSLTLTAVEWSAAAGPVEGMEREQGTGDSVGQVLTGSWDWRLEPGKAWFQRE